MTKLNKIWNWDIDMGMNMIRYDMITREKKTLESTKARYGSEVWQMRRRPTAVLRALARGEHSPQNATVPCPALTLQICKKKLGLQSESWRALDEKRNFAM
jgi:hypothetical protein